jgi:hypothetical protein
MAGGWEEVVRTGSGTGAGVKLGKQDEADEAAVGIQDEADEAALVQAKLIWLISGATMTLNFLKMSVSRMGPATAACKKLKVKSLP